ncbi:MAG: hypothetical protein L0210_06610 [Rhodospirillales bacterium]|nr:hypothetical protein [Rhodospirillales bacterium]
MSRHRRWDRCIEHRGAEVDPFVAQYFGAGDRNVLLIAGAGFDPRSTAVCARLAPIIPRMRGLFIQEQRPNPAGALVSRATQNIGQLTAVLRNHELVPVDIFGTDNAVVGGRNVVNAIHRQPFADVTDIVVDVSALSIGISYPIVRYLIERIAAGGTSQNLHIFVSPDAALDEAIIPIAGDTVGFVHGFKGGLALDANAAAAKLWLPQLARGRRVALQRIHDLVAPHDTCPILPFPSVGPRLGDELAEDYLTELESTWAVDTRNVVYAAEDDPLDLYRTVLRIDDLRRPVFESFGGSLLVLSPVGSKVLALGALMAALERNLPVVYLEAIGYELTVATPAAPTEPDLIHVWLEGDAYPSAANVAVEGGTST